MAKQIVLHYAGSYVERPHTITFDSEREYEKFIQEKGYQLKPNVEYGVFTLNSILRTQFQQSSINIEDVNEADKPDISTVTPPTLDIKYPQCNCPSDKEDNKGSDNNININITIPGLENITTNQGNVNVGTGNNQGGTNTSPKDDEGDNPTPPAGLVHPHVVRASGKSYLHEILCFGYFSVQKEFLYFWQGLFGIRIVAVRVSAGPHGFFV